MLDIKENGIHGCLIRHIAGEVLLADSGLALVVGESDCMTIASDLRCVWMTESLTLRVRLASVRRELPLCIPTLEFLRSLELPIESYGDCSSSACQEKERNLLEAEFVARPARPDMAGRSRC